VTGGSGSEMNRPGGARPVRESDIARLTSDSRRRKLMKTPGLTIRNPSDFVCKLRI